MAKRKNNKLRVKVAKNNVLYYYLKGKRIKSSEGQKIQQEQFRKRSEAAKKAAANTYKYQGRAIPRIYAKLLSKVFTNPELLKTMDLSKWVDTTTGKQIFPRFSDIQKSIDNASKQDSDIFRVLTEMGYFKDKEGRTALIDICEIIQQKEYDKFKFILIDAQGDEVRGRVSVCTAIRDFEVDVTTDIKNALGYNVVKTYFDYSPKYDFKNKIFELDLQDQDPNVEIADIVQSQKGELLLPNGKNKYKDVYITYSVS